jgi:ribosomal-protein-alanine N-acetyltransferase
LLQASAKTLGWEDSHIVNIRSATAADIPAVIVLERECATAAHWTEEQYQQIFERREGDGIERLVLVVEDDTTSSLLGFLIAQHVHPEWELENIVVASGCRRKGLGTLLLEKLVRHARETNGESVFLEVRESNQSARALYGKLGFRESGGRQGYYANPAEDAVIFQLDLC